jgi:Restriction endonuclease
MCPETSEARTAMARNWVIRTDKATTDWIWSELTAGRLRQGWGLRDDQDLHVIASGLAAGTPLSDDQRATWRGNRRLLETEPDGVRVGDLVLLPHLPRPGTWSLARVTGPYRWEGPSHGNAWQMPDYGHVLPVELISRRPINPLEDGVSARLRQTMRVLSRMWNIDGLSADVEELAEVVGTEAAEPPPPALDRLPKVLATIEAATWEALQKQFHGAEFERPCVLLLEALYGDENVEHTGGSGERGADAICTYADPLGVVHRLAVQIKMWSWDADWTRPLDQLRQAYGAYDGITGGVILSTSERVSDRFEARRRDLETELHMPIRVILRSELIRLFVTHLPVLMDG